MCMIKKPYISKAKTYISYYFFFLVSHLLLVLILGVLLRPIHGYTNTDRTGLTAPPYPTQGSAEGFRHGGRR